MQRYNRSFIDLMEEWSEYKEAHEIFQKYDEMMNKEALKNDNLCFEVTTLRIDKKELQRKIKELKKDLFWLEMGLIILSLSNIAMLLGANL